MEFSFSLVLDLQLSCHAGRSMIILTICTVTSGTLAGFPLLVKVLKVRQKVVTKSKAIGQKDTEHLPPTALLYVLPA
jgi:hypothetical protein